MTALMYGRGVVIFRPSLSDTLTFRVLGESNKRKLPECLNLLRDLLCSNTNKPIRKAFTLLPSGGYCTIVPDRVKHVE